MFVLSSLNLLKLHVSLFYTDHTFSEALDLRHMQVHPCLILACATKEVLKEEEEDSNHPRISLGAFFPPQLSPRCENQAEVSQNSKVGRDHRRSSTPTSLLRQGAVEHITQDCVQSSSEYLQERRFAPHWANLQTPKHARSHVEAILPHLFSLTA